MTPKDKAKELIGKFAFQTVTDFSDENFEQTKQCALICVDEIYKLDLEKGQHLETFIDKSNFYSYWEEVKQEILKL